mmetsp:Transcript_10206/g.15675  ORF Transcript_10206/g.15675 Transcript_10206/m.15675 type:complete len:340 (+) Transcript_10206:109-1128(+)
MNDGVFFNSLSFLKRRPFESRSWPPELPLFIARPLISGYSLSIEIPRLGPILLNTENKGDDPGMFTCDLVILDPRSISPKNEIMMGASAVYNDASILDSPIPQSPTISPKKKGNDTTKVELVLRIDEELCFRVDASRISNVVLEEECNNDKTLGSVVVEFEEDCAFRFFCKKMNGELHEVYNKLSEFPRVVPNRALERYSDAERSTKKNLFFLQKGWHETVDFFFSLQQHETSSGKVCEQLNSSASSLVFASPLELQTASVAMDDKLSEVQRKIDDVLSSFFQSARQRAKNRQQETPDKTGGTDVINSKQDALTSIKELIAKKNQILQDRYKLSFLPDR